MEYSKEFCLMVDPKTGSPRLVEPSEDPEKIVKGFLKQIKKPHSVLWAFDQLILQDSKWWKPHAALLKMLTEFDKIDID